jgi:hypothetical protein
LNRNGGYLFRFALFRAPFLALVDFLAFLAAIFRDSCHIGFGCLNLKKRSNTPPASEVRGDRSKALPDAESESEVTNRMSTGYQRCTGSRCGANSTLLIFPFVEGVNRNFFHFKNLSGGHLP